jgi:hypothetical protein
MHLRPAACWVHAHIWYDQEKANWEVLFQQPGIHIEIQKVVTLWRRVKSMAILARRVINKSFFPKTIILYIFYYLYS